MVTSWVIEGLICSGKSTLCKAIVDHFGGEAKVQFEEVLVYATTA